VIWARVRVGMGVAVGGMKIDTKEDTQSYFVYLFSVMIKHK
jgi:hypothetical protein